MCIVAPQQEPTASFEEHSKIFHVRPGEVIQADFEHVQDDMRRDDAKLCQVREESDVAQPHFR